MQCHAEPSKSEMFDSTKITWLRRMMDSVFGLQKQTLGKSRCFTVPWKERWLPRWKRRCFAPAAFRGFGRRCLPKVPRLIFNILRCWSSAGLSTARRSSGFSCDRRWSKCVYIYKFKYNYINGVWFSLAKAWWMKEVCVHTGVLYGLTYILVS